MRSIWVSGVWITTGQIMSEIHLQAGAASLTVDASNGGRLSSLEIADRQLLVIEGSLGPLQWGSYPMVPWAGRVRDGSFEFGGIAQQLEQNLPPHSAHGVGFVSSWERIGPDAIALDMADRWPYGGRVTQQFELSPDSLTITMTVEATEDMPVMVGWHPWFARYLNTDAGPVEAEPAFGPARMYELDDTAIPTGRLVAVPPGPWDNCFTELEREPVITWPGVVELALSSSCDHWVIYTEPEQALCVEPQSQAPDAFNRDARVLAAGRRLEAWFRMAWTDLSAADR